MSTLSKSWQWGLSLLIAVLVFTLFLNAERGRASLGVDMLLVISLDVSASVDIKEYNLMVDGLSTALKSPQVAQAVSAGKNGSIAITVLQWSGFQEQEVKIDWTRVATSQELAALAQEIKNMKRRYEGGATDIGGAIDFSATLFALSPFAAQRRVVDIVGDGPNNVNYSPRRARDKVVKTGVIINALAITGGIEVLGGYFEEFVIGGEGAFVEQTKDYDGFERAIHQKLLREIGNMFLF